MESFLKNLADWMNYPLVQFGQTPVTLGGIGSSVFVLLVTFIISSVIQRIVSAKLEKNPKVTSGLAYAIQRMIHYLLIFFGVIIAAQCVGLNLGSLAVVFGFLGVGIGFGLQNITSNFIAGVIILLERPISVGDFISVEGQVGQILNINMRATIIMTLDNVTIIVPNSKFIEGNVINWSIKDARVRIHCAVGVAYGSDVPKVKETLLSVAKAHPKVLDTPEPEVRFIAFGNSSLDFELLVWVDEPKKQYQIHSQINYMIDEAFRKADIHIPFPQRDLHLQMSPAVEQLAKAK